MKLLHLARGISVAAGLLGCTSLMAGTDGGPVVTASVPALDTTGLLGLAMAVGLAGAIVLWRRK